MNIYIYIYISICFVFCYCVRQDIAILHVRGRTLVRLDAAECLFRHRRYITAAAKN